MAKITTWGALDKSIKWTTKYYIVPQIANTVKSTLKFNLNKLWYQKHDNHSFTRTYELIESVLVTPVKGNSTLYEATVKFDDNINHTSWDGSFVDNNAIAWWVNYGNGGGRPDYSELGYKPSKYFEQTLKELDKALNQSIKELRKKGIILIKMS